MHVYVHGNLSSHVAQELLDAAKSSVADGLVMVVHLQSVKQITASGLGALMDVRRSLLEAGLTLSLAGLSFRHRFLLHAWCAEPLFDEWESTYANSRALVKDVQTSAGLDLQGD
jgi:ABC-type transporter Mla MlaB component